MSDVGYKLVGVQLQWMGCGRSAVPVCCVRTGGWRADHQL